MKIGLGISARHVHLTREAIDILFGKDYQLTKLKDLKNERHQVKSTGIRP